MYIDLPKEEGKSDEVYHELISTAFRFMKNNGHQKTNLVLRFYDDDFFAKNKTAIENFRFRLRNHHPRPNSKQELEDWQVSFSKKNLADFEAFLKDTMPQKIRKMENYFR